MEKERVHWIDIAKCLLIISVIVYHIPVFAEQNGVGGGRMDVWSAAVVQGLFYACLFCDNGFLQHIYRIFFLAFYL